MIRYGAPSSGGTGGPESDPIFAAFLAANPTSGANYGDQDLTPYQLIGDVLKLNPLADHAAADATKDIIYSVVSGGVKGVYIKFAGDESPAALVDRSV